MLIPKQQTEQQDGAVLQVTPDLRLTPQLLGPLTIHQVLADTS